MVARVGFFSDDLLYVTFSNYKLHFNYQLSNKIMYPFVAIVSVVIHSRVNKFKIPNKDETQTITCMNEYQLV